MSDEQRKICLNLLKLFTIDGKPVSELATEGQIEIFFNLVFRPKNRIQFITATQYGKSLFVALASIIISCIQDEMVVIVAPTDAKAKIIMRYYIEHLGDNPLFYAQLEKNTKLERLRMEESKERITLRGGGGIYTISAQASNSQKGIEAAIGAGGKIVITDESSLIPDKIEATIFRMIAGQGNEGFYCKIGNPFYRNHFFKSWKDTNYKRILIDYEQAISEGRYTQEFIDEAKRKPFFDVLYGCEFPKEDTIDDKGYMSLFTEEDILNAQKREIPFGEVRLGVDVAEGGGDYSVLVQKFANYAKVLLKYQTPDTMDLVGKVIHFAKENEVQEKNVFVDSIGVGKGVVDRLVEQKWAINAVKFSERPQDDRQFINLRAECYWRLRTWIKEGGKLEPSEDWNQLLGIKYRVVDSSGKLQIMSKEEMRKEGLYSPDVADALAICFSRKNVLSYKSREDVETLKQFDALKRSKNRSGIFTGSRYLNR